MSRELLNYIIKYIIRSSEETNAGVIIYQRGTKLKVTFNIML